MINARPKIEDLVFTQAIRSDADRERVFGSDCNGVRGIYTFSLRGRQLGVTLLDGMSITPDQLGNAIHQRLWLRLLRHSALIRIETKDSTRGTERKPNPSQGDAFAMVTGGGTLPVMGSAVMGLPTLRLPATGLRSNQAF